MNSSGVAEIVMGFVSLIMLVVSGGDGVTTLTTDYTGKDPSTTPAPKKTARETEWSAWIAFQMDGVAEYGLSDGSRVDVIAFDVSKELTVWEVEWVSKWEQAVGQSVWYGIATDKPPGIIVLLGKVPKSKEVADLLRLIAVCRHLGIKLKFVNVSTASPASFGN